MDIPRCTYRLQLQEGFGFSAVSALAPYLARLGVSHVYLSPFLQAAEGSTHGYDVVDYARVSEELGGTGDFEQMCHALEEANVAIIADLVPNHMSIATAANRWWWDVLENGSASRYSCYFDVDWNGPEESRRRAILLPILEDHYGRVLERGEFRIAAEAGKFRLCYKQHCLPLAPASIALILQRALEHSYAERLNFLTRSLARLRKIEGPPATALDYHNDKEVLLTLLKEFGEHPEGAAAIDCGVAQVNRELEALDEILQQQNYRLAYWRMADDEADFRRFFNINTLVSLRMEDDEVFEDAHRYILRLVHSGVVSGLRIDHPDGLRDPKGYFQRLRAAAPNCWIVAEKILTPPEELPASWPVQGTTGYEFLNVCHGLFVDADAEATLTTFYEELSGEKAPFHDMVREKKYVVLHKLFESDVQRLTRILSAVCFNHPRFRDFSHREIEAALREMLADYPVYRSYVRPQDGEVREQARSYVQQAMSSARCFRPDINPELFEFLAGVLLLDYPGELEAEFIHRFQQLSASVMAKGAEDTALYTFNRLIALNEVGGDPGCFGSSVDTFHAFCKRQEQNWPHSLLASSTHDTKLSEDVRLKISLLSEIPDRWCEQVRSWISAHEQLKSAGLPEANLQYRLYQIFVGAWPIEEERILAYALKAAREAKVHTTWTEPNSEYEGALETFLRRLVNDADFIASLEQFLADLEEAAQCNTLSQTLLKLTAPGVPDVYQGTELCPRLLVDPDNRRLVDFQLREVLLAQAENSNAQEVLAREERGFAKLWLTRRVLELRERCPEIFSSPYRPLRLQGTKAAHLLGFSRAEAMAVVVQRLMLKRGGSWEGSGVELPPGSWRNVLTEAELEGGFVMAEKLLETFPVALLAKN